MMGFNKRKNGLLAIADKRSNEQRYFFEGNQQEKEIAKWVAKKLGVEIGIDGNDSFATTAEGYEKVVRYIKSNKLEGWWHYSILEEYFSMREV